MAVIQFGSIVTNAKGKIAGHFLSNSLGGPTLQSTPKVTKGAYVNGNAGLSTGASSRAIVSQTLIYVVRSWKNLSAVNRAAWQAAAPNFPTTNKLGVPVKPSGYHCYVHINYGYYINHGSLLSVPPAVQIGVLPSEFTIASMSHSSIQITLSAAIPAGYMGYVKATPSISAGVKPTKTDFITVDYLATGASGTVNITTQYSARYGAAITGNTVWLSLVLSSLSTGLLGNPYIVGQAVS